MSWGCSCDVLTLPHDIPPTNNRQEMTTVSAIFSPIADRGFPVSAETAIATIGPKPDNGVRPHATEFPILKVCVVLGVERMCGPPECAELTLTWVTLVRQLDFPATRRPRPNVNNRLRS
jgi:hypothetical protein